MKAHAIDYTLPGQTLLDALERIVGPLPPRQMLPDERRTHEAAFEVEPPEPEPADEVVLQGRHDSWCWEVFGRG